MDFFDVFGKMLAILLTTAAGYLAHHLGYLGGEIDQKLCRLVLNITMPAMILAAVLNNSDMGGLSEILPLLLVSAIFYGMSLVFAAVVPKVLGGTEKQKGVWRYSLVFANVAFIGYPVARALFGESSIFYAAILVLPFNLLSYTLGPMMLAGQGRFDWKQMLSPCVVASVIALVLALTGLRLPSSVGETIGFLGDVTTPLSLLVVGSLLADLPIKQVFIAPRPWILTILRLLVMPALFFLLLKPLHLDPMVMGVAVSQMAMPVAVNGSMLAMEYGGDTDAMAQVTFLTTLFSTFTIPIIAVLFF